MKKAKNIAISLLLVVAVIFLLFRSGKFYVPVWESECNLLYIHSSKLIETDDRADSEINERCSHDYGVRLYGEDKKRFGNIRPQARIRVDVFENGKTIHWYDHQNCYAKFIQKNRDFEWKEKNCPDVKVNSLDDIIDLLGEPDETINKRSYDAIQYTEGENHGLYIEKDGRLIHVTDPKSIKIF
jgi:hypothetical protein